MCRPIQKGSTDQSVVIRIVDSGDGTPETGVEHDTAGIDLSYRREGGAVVSITEAALSALTDAHSDGGIEHIAAGYYRLDLPDAAVAAGANGVWVGGTITGMVVIGCYVPLVDYDPYGGGEWIPASDMPTNWPALAVGADGVVEANVVQTLGEAAEAETVSEAVHDQLCAAWSTFQAEADPLSLAALIPAAFKFSLTANAGKLTTYLTDGSEFHQYTLTSAAGAEAITVLSN